MLNEYLSNRLIQAFLTKKEAQAYATSIGWPRFNVVKVAKRFETVWIVAQGCHQSRFIAGMEFEFFLLPTGNYEVKNGSNQMIVLEVKKYIEKKVS